MHFPAEPMEDEVPLEFLDSLEVSRWLSFGGPAEKIFSDFEEREGQLDLLQHICTAFNEDKIGVFEAGTGVGKSFAYLIPAVLWALKNKERTVISTGTINLQQQLFEKDIPAVRRLLGSDFKAALMKGRQNYLCLRRLHDSLEEADLFDEEKEILQTIAEWGANCETGSISDLTFMPSYSVWQRVNSESDACLMNRCPFFERCFVMKMRKKAAEASILIINHHLLFADISMRSNGQGFSDSAVLPPYKRLILDEAHGIEKAATSFFSDSVNRFTFIKQLNKLHRVRKTAAAGLLYTVHNLSSAGNLLQEIVSAIQLIRAHVGDLEEAALIFLDGSSSRRICTDTAPCAGDFIRAAGILAKDIAGLCAAVRELIDGIDEDLQNEQCVWETKTVLRRLENAAAVCKHFGEWEARESSVFWVEKHSLEGGGFYPVCNETPLDIASPVYENLFKPLCTVVCTSATMASADTGKENFGYWLERTGACFVEKQRLECLFFASPFNYRQNLLLTVASDMPLPGSGTFQQVLEDAIVRLIRASSGRALVLFTSYDSLQSACSYARSILPKEGIAVLKQGDDDRFRLLQTFKRDRASVLFATDSFWEGVDVPGESLSHVIIVKLPFTVPSDPVFQARCENLESRGLSSFMHLSVPEAIIRFRQGVGRLIRSCSDRGAVSVLDKRLIETRYGTLFLNSLPETKRFFGTVDELCASITRFISA